MENINFLFYVNVYKTLIMYKLLLLLFFLMNGAYAQDNEGEFFESLVKHAYERLNHKITYDPSYSSIPYPNGDVPQDKGVCTDLIIRIYRKMGIDLQKEVHEDMKSNFSKYPKRWGLKKTDTNIDHRRVPNLEVFFTRKNASLPITQDPSDYKPGDLVSWDLGGNIPHIGIVVDKKSSDTKRYLLIHNIGRGSQMEDILFDFKITGHFRYKK